MYFYHFQPMTSKVTTETDCVGYYVEDFNCPGLEVECSCLENPRDGGAWWAAIYGVVQSWTRLKQLGSRGSIYHSHLHSIIQSCVMWAYLIVEELKNIVYLCEGRRKDAIYWKTLTFSSPFLFSKLIYLLINR